MFCNQPRGHKFFVRYRAGTSVILCFQTCGFCCGRIKTCEYAISFLTSSSPLFQPTSSLIFSVRSKAMAEQGIEEPTIQPISRFSTSTSLRLTAAQEHNAMVVPMPKWSNIVGFARVVLAILVLAFTAAATAIWGGYAAFGLTLFTVSCKLRYPQNQRTHKS